MLIIEPTQEELSSGALSYLNGEFVRFPDGLSLPIPLETLNALKPANYTDYTVNRCSTPVVENGVAYKLANENSVVMFKLSAPEEDRLKPEIVREIPFNTDRFPYYYNPGHVASPLLHEGLLYCVNTFGVLMVMDVAKGEVVYQRLLDLDIFMPYNGVTGYLKGGA
ncbi:MAG: hypothetical protein O3B01_24230 [Planctomycetota bacterium]|nr:hypothetical protein [Planctomycetota bacterium]MDA1141683.1 hypothetical protein [Planctomycetota bacterium]